MDMFGFSWVRPETTFSYSIPFYSIKIVSIRPWRESTHSRIPDPSPWQQQLSNKSSIIMTSHDKNSKQSEFNKRTALHLSCCPAKQSLLLHSLCDPLWHHHRGTERELNEVTQCSRTGFVLPSQLRSVQWELNTIERVTYSATNYYYAKISRLLMSVTSVFTEDLLSNKTTNYI